MERPSIELPDPGRCIRCDIVHFHNKDRVACPRPVALCDSNVQPLRLRTPGLRVSHTDVRAFPQYFSTDHTLISFLIEPPPSLSAAFRPSGDAILAITPSPEP
ncbi:hypothetical protein TcasGA2_TC008115 [Tribolium castaneum]|uniref:Uncharacterized protein n=1 Tax=Tribolium castaneum TaxID=7070 RepID=D1ZZW4_TRICA|nr:hypothetical protein TcasGA2_TC008115 [Tribolium castaneum]